MDLAGDAEGLFDDEDDDGGVGGLFLEHDGSVMSSVGLPTQASVVDGGSMLLEMLLATIGNSRG